MTTPTLPPWLSPQVEILNSVPKLLPISSEWTSDAGFQARRALLLPLSLLKYKFNDEKFESWQIDFDRDPHH